MVRIEICAMDGWDCATWAVNRQRGQNGSADSCADPGSGSGATRGSSLAKTAPFKDLIKGSKFIFLFIFQFSLLSLTLSSLSLSLGFFKGPRNRRAGHRAGRHRRCEPSCSSGLSDRGWRRSRASGLLFSDRGLVSLESAPRVVDRGFKASIFSFLFLFLIPVLWP